MKKCILLLVILYVAFLYPCIAQNTLGTPVIKNYTHEQYNAGNETWHMAQDKNGLLYFANDDGLLIFDGSYWKTYPMPNKSAIKSVAIDSKGRILVGGLDEIGYFFPNDMGVLKYHSLTHLLPKRAKQFADVWDIVIYKDEVFFRTIECIFELKNNTIRTFDAPGGWMILTSAGHNLFAYDKDEGLLIFKNGSWQPATDKPLPNRRVTGAVDFGGDSVLLATRSNGLMLLNGKKITAVASSINAALRTDLVNFIQNIGNNRYAIGTAAKGIFIIDKNLKLIDHFSNNQGLQNNNVHRVLVDNNRNLWLGLENGIDFIIYNTAVKQIVPNRENQLKSNAVAVFRDKLYIGTSNGLYAAPLNQLQTDISKDVATFTEVEKTKGHVWSLAEINGRLLAGHQDGVLEITGNKATPITAGPGAWMLKQMPNSNHIIAGTYTGFQLLKGGDATFSFEGKINGIYESLGNLAIDGSGTLWASHPFRGLYRVKLSADNKKVPGYTHYTNKNGLPSSLNNHVYFIRDQVIAATTQGVYEYNAAADKFIISPFYQKIFGQSRIDFLTTDGEGNIWFSNSQRAGVVDFGKRSASKPYTITYFPELAGQTVKATQYIYPYNRENVFVGSENGVFHLNYRQYVSAENKLNVILTSVKTIGDKDSVIFGGYFTDKGKIVSSQNAKQVTSLANKWNSFHFEYSSTLYAQKSNEEFTYKLVGFDNEWSKWSGKTEKDYTNLPYGKYTFSVKVRNNLGAASAPVSYTFIVEPAWYQTVWAYLLYAVFAVYLVYIGVKFQQKRLALQQQKHQEEQKRLNYLHSLELDRNEKEIIALQNDKLGADLIYKNKELATLTMQMVDRGKLLLNIKDELMVLIKKQNIPDASYQFRSVFRLLGDSEKSGDWDNFALYFDEVHNNFLTILKAKFPALSSTDLKLCAYLRLNLSSKEIAQLLNISLKGVEISRYRVRKKLQITTETNLYDFLMEVAR
ncbi:transcriptional regulator [Mucilaginibacter sp. ZT4R22]|uniref:Transcriptional regulator n=1 Tax=Mucilaginibacter pankratovii TaxID=2772110 RepID=A0ABR7WK79_9SPHI|nr:triple tyrosine motif-containing protein [Mucilaginibacter pankratovii]MBD1362728.1 transcriptional regulator [Mucilaginibacter pankratovii]